MADPQNEAERDALNDDHKTAFSWSRDEAETQRLQGQQRYHYVWWTFFVAIAVVIVSVIAVSVTLLH